jgi:hypothetical protein
MSETTKAPALTDDTLVRWIENVNDIHWSRFGSLAVQERKTVQWNAAMGYYEGGYPY